MNSVVAGWVEGYDGNERKMIRWYDFMIKKKQSIVTAYVHPGTVHQDFAECLLDMAVKEVRGKDRIHSNITVSHAYIPHARNHVVKMFLETDAEWLLFFDYDMVFEPDFLERMAEVADAQERRLVAGLYFNYLFGDKIHPTWLIKNRNDELCTIASIPPNALVEVDSVGMGGTLIHRSIFEKMAEAYKDDFWQWFGHDLVTEKGAPIRLGEDTTFCMRARNLGVRIWGYSGVQMGHIKSKMLTYETAMEQQKKDKTMIYGKEYYDSLARLVSQFKPKNGLEIGTEYGVSTDAFLSHSDMKLISLDPQDFGLENLRQKYGDRLVLMYNVTLMELMNIRPCQFDWIYIDGDRTYEAAKKDIENAWPMLESSGVMVLDDYGNEERGVKQAVNEFVAANGLETNLVEGNPHGAVYIQKV